MKTEQIFKKGESIINYSFSLARIFRFSSLFTDFPSSYCYESLNFHRFFSSNSQFPQFSVKFISQICDFLQNLTLTVQIPPPNSFQVSCFPWFSSIKWERKVEKSGKSPYSSPSTPCYLAYTILVQFLWFHTVFPWTKTTFSVFGQCSRTTSRQGTL